MHAKSDRYSYYFLKNKIFAKNVMIYGTQVLPRGQEISNLLIKWFLNALYILKNQTYSCCHCKTMMPDGMYSVTAYVPALFDRKAWPWVLLLRRTLRSLWCFVFLFVLHLVIHCFLHYAAVNSKGDNDQEKDSGAWRAKEEGAASAGATRLVLKSVSGLALCQDSNENAVWSHAAGLAAVVPGVRHGHRVDSQRRAVDVLKSNKLLENLTRILSSAKIANVKCKEKSDELKS